MVFESVIVSALNPILGKYVEDLDAGQLRVGILGGDIKLEKVKLKQNILADLNLPISVHTGLKLTDETKGLNNGCTTL